jgi:hypothetical protein
MGKFLTYPLEGEPSRRFHELRVRASEEHLMFDGDEHEGEFIKRFPHASMELRGLYSIDDNMLSISLTEVPEGHTLERVENMFLDLLGSPKEWLEKIP